jgi:hypothetical protein
MNVADYEVRSSQLKFAELREVTKRAEQGNGSIRNRGWF